VAVVAGLLFGTTRLVWEQSVVAEVYSLQTFLVFLTFTLAVLPDLKKSPNPWKMWWVSGLVGGLAVGYRPDSILCLGPVLVYIGIRCRKSKDFKRLAGVCGLAVVGTIPSILAVFLADVWIDHPSNLYNLLRPYFEAAYRELPDGRSYYARPNADVILHGSPLRRLIWLLSCEHIRYAYGDTGWREAVRELKHFCTLTWNQIGVIGLIAAAVGCFSYRKENWYPVPLGGAILCAYLVSYMKLGIPGMECYYLPLWAILAVLAARGIAILPWLWGRVGVTSLLLLMILVRTVGLYPEFRRQRLTVNHNYEVLSVRALAHNLDRNSVVVSEWGPMNSLLYALYVEEKRGDVLVAQAPIGEETHECELLASRYPKRPLYLYHGGHIAFELSPRNATRPARLIPGKVWRMKFPKD